MILLVPAACSINYGTTKVEIPLHLLSQGNGCKPWYSSCKPVTEETN